MFLYEQDPTLPPSINGPWQSVTFEINGDWDFVSWAAVNNLTKVAINVFISQNESDVFDSRQVSEKDWTYQPYPWEANWLNVTFQSTQLSRTSLTPLLVEHILSPPSIIFPGAEVDSSDYTKYTVVMVDRDPFSAADPVVGPLRLWMVTNIPGSLIATTGVNGTFKALTPYTPPQV